MTVAKLDSVSTGYPIARSEQVVAKTFDVSCAYVVGADGYDSFVRRRLVVDFEDLGGRQIMSVYQCEVDGKLPQEGRFMFSMLGVGAYWSLQGGRCRLSFPVASEAGHRPDAAGLAAHLAEHAPWFDNEIRSLEWTATASFERRLAATFGRDRVWLAGDSAHLTWPAGAQSMNVGLRESADLAERIAQVSRRAAAASTLADYGTSQRAEWRRLLGSGAKLGRRAQDWTADHAAGCCRASRPPAGTWGSSSGNSVSRSAPGSSSANNSESAPTRRGCMLPSSSGRPRPGAPDPLRAGPNSNFAGATFA